MKRLLFIATLAATATACVEGNNPVQLVGARSYSPTECGTREDLFRKRGFLNYSVSSSYVLAFGLFSPLSQEENSTGTGTGFIASEIVYNYESLGVKSTFKEESLPIYLAVPAGADPDDSYIGIDLIGAEARKKLDSLVPAAPDTMTLLTTVKVKGKLASGRSAETNEVTFPIELTRGPGCGENQTAVPPESAPCANPGQDGIGWECI